MYKIYKIVDNTNDNIYIGITKKKYLSYRLSQHKYEYKTERGKNCMSKEIIMNGDYKIELIEETDDKLRERYWIQKLNCVNKVIPGRTQDEYYKDNKEKLIQKSKEYYEKNTEKIIQQKREYYKKNTEKKREYYNYRNSWGGDKRFHNNLLRIDINLFLN